MKLKNYQMDNLMSALEPILEHKGMLGYAASRNYRKLRDATLEYTQYKINLFQEHGRAEMDENGNPTQRYVIDITDPEASEAIKEFDRYAEIEHDVDLFKIPVSEAINELNGRELLSIELMLDDEEDCG